MRWQLRHIDESQSVGLGNLPAALARALWLRGVQTMGQAQLFFKGELRQTHDPFLMKGMREATDRIWDGLDRWDENILAFTDYDVDGTSAAAILKRNFPHWGTFVPSRFEHGYGLSSRAAAEVISMNPGLVITADCGISDADRIASLNSVGIDTIVTDHHLPPAQIPQGIVVNPNQEGCEYPNKGLCGAAVAWQFTQALDQKPKYLELVALATVADVVPMTAENRILVKEGLKAMATTEIIGLKALAEIAEVDLQAVTPKDIGWKLGPRINAAGRIGAADVVVDLMTTEDQDEAISIARRLDRLNEERRAISKMIHEEASEMVAGYSQSIKSGLILHGSNWHAGVSGIAASRLVEEYSVPTILLMGGGKEIKGSARSVPGLNIREVLQDCSHLLTKFGGHAGAAGMSLPADNLPAFRDAFAKAVESRGGIQPPVEEYDAELDPSDIDDAFIRVLEKFEPFGPGNPEPVWRAKTKVWQAREIGKDQSHLKLKVGRQAGAQVEAVAFSHGFLCPILEYGTPVDILFTAGLNHYMGSSSIQLNIKAMTIPT